MPTVPPSVSRSNVAALNKGYYHGIVFNIPGAEVKIDGQWTPFSHANQSLIKAKNPMTLEWRLNGDLLRKLGYKPSDTVAGTIIVVDDQWHGLNISNDITIQLKQ